jgi:hypothetical protein
MTCKLCLQNKKLIKKSHLFPKFMYNGIRDEKNRMSTISSDNLNDIGYVQSGAYDEYILCNNCDNNILSNYERYAANHFYKLNYRENNENFCQIDKDNIQFIFCKNLDYSKFKIFLLSLLWRVSISSHYLFKDFKLPLDDEEKIRKAILKGDPLEELEFSCSLSTHQNDEKVLTDFILIKPTTQKKVIFYINDFIYTFYLDSNEVGNYEQLQSIKRSNEMLILKLPHGFWEKIRGTIVETVVAQGMRNSKKS